MQQLLAIPDRDRSDAEWDELNELEIQLAPGNRDTGSARVPGAPAAPRPAAPRGQGKGHQRPAGSPKAQAQQQGNTGNAGNTGNSPADGEAAPNPQAKKPFRKPRPPRQPRSEGNG